MTGWERTLFVDGSWDIHTQRWGIAVCSSTGAIAEAIGGSTISLPKDIRSLEIHASTMEALAIQLGLCTAQRMREQHVRIITDRYATIENLSTHDYYSLHAAAYSSSFTRMLLRLRWHLEWFQHAGITVTFQARVREGNEQWTPHHLANAARTSKVPCFRLNATLWIEEILWNNFKENDLMNTFKTKLNPVLNDMAKIITFQGYTKCHRRIVKHEAAKLLTADNKSLMIPANTIVACQPTDGDYLYCCDLHRSYGHIALPAPLKILLPLPPSRPAPSGEFGELSL